MAYEAQKAYLKNKTKQIPISLKPDEYEKLKKVLSDRGISLADLIRCTARYYKKKRETN